MGEALDRIPEVDDTVRFGSYTLKVAEKGWFTRLKNSDYPGKTLSQIEVAPSCDKA